MMRVLFWKELREQAAVVIALVALGVGLLAANVVLNPTTGGTRASDIGHFAVILLTMAAGVVIGGTLFAGEKEQKTFGYLDRLPGTRRAVWPRKLLPGAVLTAVAAVLLWAAGAAFGILGDAKEITVWAIILGAISVGSFGWGSVGSTRSSTSIGATGLAIAYAMIGLCAAILFGAIAEGALMVLFGKQFPSLEHGLREQLPVGMRAMGGGSLLLFPVVAFALFGMPYPLSYWLYTQPDRARGSVLPRQARLTDATSGRWGADSPKPVRSKRPRRAPSRSQLAWLVRRQFVPGALALWALAPLLGLTLLIPEFVIPVALVSIGTMLGLFAAVIVWQDEQTSEANRFWGERRIPATRVWFWKTLAGLLFCLVTGVLLALPAVLVVIVKMNGPYVPGISRGSALGIELFVPGYPFFTMLFLGPVTGFAFGQLAAMLFRKAIVAIAVGTMIAGVFAAAWLPSLAAGGLHPGMAFVPALVALGTARLLAWSWAGGTVGSGRAVARLVGGLTAALLTVGAGLAVRAYEVDPGSDPDADLVFAATLPTTDVEHAGRVLRSIAVRRTDYNDFSPARDAVLDGYDADEQEQWLAALAADPSWQDEITKVAGMPVAVLEDPNEYYFDTRPRYIRATEELLDAHLALGLRAQSLGDPADFVKRFGEVLACARLVRNKTFLEGHFAARGIEIRAYAALGHWLKHLGNRPELLTMAQTHLTNHAESPYDTRDPILARQTVARRSVAAPGQWLSRFLSDPMAIQSPESRAEPSKRAAAEAEFLALMWAFPWEQERLNRIVAGGNTAGNDLKTYFKRSAAVSGLSPELILVSYRDMQLPAQVEAIRTSVEMRQQLALAALSLRRYYAANGQFPSKFDAVVPKYLPQMPPTMGTTQAYNVDLMNNFPNLARQIPSGRGGSLIPFEYSVVLAPTLIDLGDPTQTQQPVELPLFIPDELSEAGGALAGGIAVLTPELLTPPQELPPRQTIRLKVGEALVNYGVVRMAVPGPAGK